MRQLHLSREWFHDCRPEYDPRTPTPICGADDGVATVKRGRGDGLVPPAAWDPEFHCRTCYLRMLRDPSAAD